MISWSRGGVERAKGLVAVLSTDADNVYTTLSAKVLNPKLFVVSRALEEETELKLRRAGATRVVKPYEIGASRMAQVLIRPHVVDFIDQIAYNVDVDLHIEQIHVSSDSSLAGKTLEEIPLRKNFNIMIIAIIKKSGQFIYNPQSAEMIEPQDQLIAIGSEENLGMLNQLCFLKEV